MPSPILSTSCRKKASFIYERFSSVPLITSTCAAEPFALPSSYQSGHSLSFYENKKCILILVDQFSFGNKTAAALQITYAWAERQYHLEYESVFFIPANIIIMCSKKKDELMDQKCELTDNSTFVLKWLCTLVYEGAVRPMVN